MSETRPYIPTPGDLCGRCASPAYPVVARCFYSSRWIINVCESCLMIDEVDAAVKRTIDVLDELAGGKYA